MDQCDERTAIKREGIMHSIPRVESARLGGKGEIAPAKFPPPSSAAL